MHLQLNKGGFHSDRLDCQRKCSDAHQCSKKCPNTLADTNHKEHMFAQMSGQPSGHLDPRAPVLIGVQTAN
jgi:hypothetical protein